MDKLSSFQIPVSLDIFVQPIEVFFCHLLQSGYIHVIFQVMQFHSPAQRIQTCPPNKLFIGFILISGYGKNGLYNVWRESL